MKMDGMVGSEKGFASEEDEDDESSPPPLLLHSQHISSLRVHGAKALVEFSGGDFAQLCDLLAQAASPAHLAELEPANLRETLKVCWGMLCCSQPFFTPFFHLLPLLLSEQSKISPPTQYMMRTR